MEKYLENITILITYYLIFRYGIQMKRRRIGKNFLKIDISIYLSFVVCIFASCIIEHNSNLLRTSPLFYFLWVAVAILISFKDKVKAILLITSFTMISVSLSQIISIVTVQIIARIFHLREVKYIQVYAALLMLSFIIFLGFQIPSKYVGRLRIIDAKYYALLLVSEGISILSITTMWGIIENRRHGEVRVRMILILLMILFNMYFQITLLLSLAIKKGIYREENKKYKQVISETKIYQECMKEQELKTRRFRHDIRAHMTILSEFIKARDIGKIEDYVKDMKIEIEEITNSHSIGNEVADIILNKYLKEFDKYGTDFHVRGCFLDAKHISGYDMCTILSNLLENAQEATKSSMHGFVNLNIVDNYTQTMIVCENNFEGVRNGIGSTSKMDAFNHGFGLLNIQDCVIKYGGNLIFDTSEQTFSVTILIPKENINICKGKR